MTAQAPSATEPAPMRCPRCRSTSIRRSLPRSGLEQLVRAWTPFHFFLCRDCGYRGSHLGAIRVAKDSGDRVPSRPLEVRDLEEVRRRRRKLITSMLVATTLGVAAGAYLHSCRPSVELEQMQAPQVEQHRIE